MRCFYIQSGKVKLTVLSQRDKEAVIAILSEASFFGRGLSGGSTGSHVYRWHSPAQHHHSGEEAGVGSAHVFEALGSRLRCWLPLVRCREPFSVLPNAAFPAFAVDRSSEIIFFDARTVSASFAFARAIICRFSPVSAMT